jgi:GT2 family glycosyltransferase
MSRYRVSIVIPLFNKVDYTAACLDALARNTPDGLYEVVLVDNGSTDDTPVLLDALEGDVQIIRNERNLGFAVASNQGAAAAEGQDIVFLNNDTVAHPGWLEPLLAVLDADDRVGAVGSRLLYPDGTIQHGGVVTFEHEGGASIAAVHDHHRQPSGHPPALRRRMLDVVTGACLLVRREAFEQAGSFDEGYWNGNEDVDLCLTLRAAGWRIVYEPASVLVHHESVSGPERFRLLDQNIERLQQRWAGRYLPPLLITDTGVVRSHPRNHPTLVWITGAGVDECATAPIHCSRRRSTRHSPPYATTTAS